jgi:type I restriction enzyme S subunit
VSAELPTGWYAGRLGEVAIVNPPGATATANDNALVSFLPMAAVSELTGQIDLSIKRRFREVKKGFTRFKNGDVLFAKITPSMENGKIAVARDLEGGVGCGTTEFHVIRPEHGIEADYLRYFFVQSAYRNEARRNMQGAVGQQRVPPDFMRDSLIPVAPSPEQKRIVSKIDELFSRVDDGEHALQGVRALVERYRQSVIRAAITGELTRDWREKNKSKLESRQALLTRVLKARREVWEKAEWEKIKTNTITRASHDWKNKYDAGVAPSVGIAELPETWAHASLEQATRADRPIAYGVLQPGPDLPGGVPCIRVCDIADGGVDLSQIKKIDPAIAAEFPRTRLSGGEVLLTLVGTIGRTAVVPQELAEANVARAVGVLVPNEGVTAAWLEMYLRYEKTRQLLVRSSREVARKTLNLEQLREVALPVPSVLEQREAISRLEQYLSKIAAVEQTLTQQLRTSTVLRQATLKAAFAGQLVPQDPSDTPATALVEGVAAERGSASAPPKHRRKKKSGA